MQQKTLHDWSSKEIWQLHSISKISAIKL